MIKHIKGAKIIPTSQYNIDKKAINKNAMRVLQTLKQAGFDAYIVGGGVRDLLLDRHPKDFDVVTDAKPNEVRELFKNCRLIGRRFRLAHVYFRREVVEVATFRGHHHGGKPHQGGTRNGMVVRDNVYGNIEEDAYRRDFTINALYYDAIDDVLVDFVSGFKDLQHKTLHVIGDPETRFREDPVRMLRAVRFVGKLGFTLTSDTQKAIVQLSHLLGYVSAVRLHDEIVKLFHCGFAENVFPVLQEYGLMLQLFPLVVQSLEEDAKGIEPLLNYLLKNTDKRVHAHRSVMSYFLFAALLWHPLSKRWQALKGKALSNMKALDVAASEILHNQCQHIAIPKRAVMAIREIWRLQPRLETRRARTIENLLNHPRFRAAYDLFAMRAKGDKSLRTLAKWWADIQEVADWQKKRMITELNPDGEKTQRVRRGTKRLFKKRSR